MEQQKEIDFYLSVFKDLGIADADRLIPFVKPRKIDAGEIYIQEGATGKKLAYISRGLIRTYLLKASGDEITLMLRWEGQFIASVDSVLFNRASRFFYQALEDTEIIEVDYDKIQPVVNNNPLLSLSRNDFLLNMLAEAMERIETFVLLSPEERYVKLLEEKPDILNRVPGKYLSTMLGITPVSLSRIRSRIASAGKL